MSFKLLIDKVCKATTLKMPDWEKEFIVNCDASNNAIGGVISQIIDDKEYPICFDSRTFSKKKANYSTTRKELLAVIYCVEKFRPYIFERKSKLKSNHSSLQWLSNFKNPNEQIARWIKKFSQYNFILIYRKGSNHTNADA